MASASQLYSRHLSWHQPSTAFAYCLTIVAAAIWLGLILGRDTPWDYFSYHAYSAFLLSHDRLGLDYFAAGLQGYMNPIGFVPFALARAVGLNSIGIGALLAAVHALNGIFLLLICRLLSRARPDLTAVLFPSMLLGIVSPIFLMHLGSTFTDPIGSVCVIGSVWLVLKRSQVCNFGAGILISAAVAIKLTNGVFAIALVAMTLTLDRQSVLTWLRACVPLCAGSLVGLVIFQGYWSWRLYTFTGNPFFPFFNGIFKSALIPVASNSVGRFVPATFGEFLSLPLDLARYSSWSHLEIPAPTLVPLAATMLAPLLICKLMFQRLRPSAPPPLPEGTMPLATFCATASMLWAMTSGNSRYALPLFLLLGPLIGLMLSALCARRYAILAIWLVLLAQLFMTVDARIIRWRSQQWTQDWVSVAIPSELSSRPALFISLALQSQSILIPHLHPRSAYVHLNNGHFSVPSFGPGSVPLWKLIKRFGYRAKVVLQQPRLLGREELPVEASVEYGDDYLDRISMRIVGGSCVRLAVNAQAAYRFAINRRLPSPVTEALLVCDAVAAPSRHAALRAAAEQIMDAYEDKCPNLFSPRRPQVEMVRQVWVRIYPKYDSAVLLVNFETRNIAYELTGQFKDVAIGSTDTWRQDVQKFDCRMPYGGARGYKGFAAEVEKND